jgi:hypothetical protein
MMKKNTTGRRYESKRKWRKKEGKKREYSDEGMKFTSWIKQGR